MTRGIAMTVLAAERRRGCDDGDSWYWRRVAWAQESGASTERARGAVTREQLAATLYRLSGLLRRTTA